MNPRKMRNSKSDTSISTKQKDIENNICIEHLKRFNELTNVDPNQVTESLLHGMTEDEKALFRNGIEFMRKRISAECKRDTTNLSS